MSKGKKDTLAVGGDLGITETRVTVTVVSGSGNSAMFTSQHTGTASAVLNALDRTLNAYVPEIEAEMQSWVSQVRELGKVFGRVFTFLPAAKESMSWMQLREDQRIATQELEENKLRATALDQRAEGLRQRQATLDAREQALIAHAARGDAVSGESVDIQLSGQAIVRVNVNGTVHSYLESTVRRPYTDEERPERVRSLASWLNAMGLDSDAELPDFRLAEILMEHVEQIIAMNREIQGDHDSPTDIVTVDPFGPDAEPIVGTGPIRLPDDDEPERTERKKR